MSWSSDLRQCFTCSKTVNRTLKNRVISKVHSCSKPQWPWKCHCNVPVQCLYRSLSESCPSQRRWGKKISRCKRPFFSASPGIRLFGPSSHRQSSSGRPRVPGQSEWTVGLVYRRFGQYVKLRHPLHSSIFGVRRHMSSRHFRRWHDWWNRRNHWNSWCQDKRETVIRRGSKSCNY